MRAHLRFAAVVGAAAVSLIAAAPAIAAAPDTQAGANAITLKIADQDGQGTGLATATYQNGHETKTGETKPAFPNPGNQTFVTGGVLAQEATAKPGFSAACAGLAGDGGSDVNIGDSHCLTPGNLVTGSLADFDFGDLVSGGGDAILSQFPAALTDQLDTILGPLEENSEQITGPIDSALAQAAEQFGDAGLVADLDMIEGRCTAGDGGPTGTSTISKARLLLKLPDGSELVLVDLSKHPDSTPPPNTHVFTDLGDVLALVLDEVRTDLDESFRGQAAQLGDALGEIEDQVVKNIKEQFQSNLGPLEQDLLDITLNWQQHPTADSIKVRALNVDVLPAAKDQLNGNPLANLQVGNAACAPVARVAVAAPAAQPEAPQSLPTAVSAGLATAPTGGQQHDRDAMVLAALAIMLAGGSALVLIRWLQD
jgi:hypothetical protein